MSLTPNAPSSTSHIVLQVGECFFHTSVSSLSDSRVLTAKVSGRWEDSKDKQADSSYFLDADPEIFKYILRFLRHGAFPLCYDNTRGHDYATYTAILQLADYLQVDELTEWLAKKEYLRAVRTRYQAQIVEGEIPLACTLESDMTVKHYPYQKTKKTYVCPRNIAVHYGDPRRCGRQCQNAQGGARTDMMRRLCCRLLLSRRWSLSIRSCLECLSCKKGIESWTEPAKVKQIGRFLCNHLESGL